MALAVQLVRAPPPCVGPFPCGLGSRPQASPTLSPPQPASAHKSARTSARTSAHTRHDEQHVGISPSPRALTNTRHPYSERSLSPQPAKPHSQTQQPHPTATPRPPRPRPPPHTPAEHRSQPHPRSGRLCARLALQPREALPHQHTNGTPRGPPGRESCPAGRSPGASRADHQSRAGCAAPARGRREAAPPSQSRGIHFPRPLGRSRRCRPEDHKMNPIPA